MQQMSRLWPAASRPIAALLLLAAASVNAASVNPALAQSVEELDQLVQSTGTAEDGLALARSQAESGHLLDALATLDRTIAVKPKNKQARLLHASILCLVDDRVGAAVEFARLKSKDYSKAQWAAARAPCATESATQEADE